jgi:hypothetical protein
MATIDLRLLQIASEAFCTQPLPDDWESLSETLQEQWLRDNKNLAHAGFEPYRLGAMIYDHAESIARLIRDDASKTQTPVVMQTIALLLDSESNDEGTFTRATFHLDDHGIVIGFEGYSDHTSDDHSGSPIFIERCEGDIVLRVFGDINREEPTHTISLAKARIDNRTENGDE